MMTQALITLPQSAPPQSTTKGADASSVTGRNQAANKTDDQQTDSFSSVLSRQLQEQNPPATEGQGADTKFVTVKKVTDDQELRAEQDPAAVPDGITQAFTALLLGNPESRLNVASNAPVEGSASAGKLIGKEALSAAGLPTEGKAAQQLLDNQKSLTTVATNTRAVSADDLNNTTEFKLTSVKEEIHLPQHESAINAQASTQTNAQANVLAASMQASTPQAVTTQHVQAQISAPVHSRVWPDEFSQKVSWISTQQNQSAELLLNPPDLGPVRVVLNVSDNQATALFSSPHAAVRDAIENALPKLREVMADNGIMLGNATVNDQAARDSSGFMNQRSNARTDAIPSGSAPTEPSVMATPVAATRRHIGMVDTFA